MTVKAYALLRFNHKTMKILGWSVYSHDEGNVTCDRNTRYARITEGYGDTYEEARAHAISCVKAWSPGLGEPS